MARRRYRKSHQVVESHIREEESPWRTALKQWNRSITKSCDDAKLELFPGARPPDTTFRSWYDLTQAVLPSGIHSDDHLHPSTNDVPTWDFWACHDRRVCSFWVPATHLPGHPVKVARSPLSLPQACRSIWSRCYCNWRCLTSFKMVHMMVLYYFIIL